MFLTVSWQQMWLRPQSDALKHVFQGDVILEILFLKNFLFSCTLIPLFFSFLLLCFLFLSQYLFSSVGLIFLNFHKSSSPFLYIIRHCESVTHSQAFTAQTKVQCVISIWGKKSVNGIWIGGGWLRLSPTQSSD